jgi:phthalate 4,5-dioxygenase oxygenase subunit
MAITAETQNLLTRVENGAAMGRYLRANYWFPACRSASLEPDGPPRRVRLLGENFVAFRSTDGRLGFFREGCPHRGVSLTLARNEDNALRCIYHGWKFGVDGVVREVPTQPEHHAEFCRKVPLKHFPTREGAGILWVWLGDRPAPELPNYEFLGLPDAQIHVTYQRLPFNWFQGIEGQVDASHVTQLHKDLFKTFVGTERPEALAAIDEAPTIEFDDFPGGFRYGAVRNIAEGKQYIRVTGYALPWFSYIPFEGGTCVIHVPEDDVTTGLYMMRYNRNGPLKPDHLNPVADADNFPPYLEAGPEGRWGQDRDLMRRTSWAGFPRHAIQEDFAVAASQGVIADRAGEFLNAADHAVVRVRKLYANAVNDWASGKPVRVEPPSILACGLIVPPNTNWRTVDSRSEYMKQ